MLNTPILFLIFNRPEYTFKTFESIRKAKPKQLFIASDGQRKNKAGEKQIVEKLRKDVLSKIDWKCKVTTLFRKKNLGCRNAVSGAITWFFKNVEQGIILEDDCVPNQSFYPFCEQMLNKYKDDTRISMVAGTNHIFDKVNNHQEDYFFSKNYVIWGWATWRRVWNKYDLEMKNWSEHKSKYELYNLYDEDWARRFTKMFDSPVVKGTWDISWVYTCIFENTLAISPIKNLVSNIGDIGTHKGETGNDPFIKRATKEFDFKNIKHPKQVFPSRYLNNLQFNNIIEYEKIRDSKSKLKYFLRLRFITKPIEKIVKKVFRRKRR